MRQGILLALLLTGPAAAQAGDDAAHRADRLRTARLNQEARKAGGIPQVSAADRQAYQRSLDEYRARLAAWRRQVDACERGQYDACE